MRRFDGPLGQIAVKTFRAVAANPVAFIGRMSSRDEVLDAIEPLRVVPMEGDLIRMGGGRDGGYLLPDDLDGIAACFSPGVDVTAEFEREFVERTGAKCFMADYSVDGVPSANDHFDFERKFIGTAKRPEYIDFEDWIEAKMGADKESDLLLQIDIEGAELDVLSSASRETLKRFRIILVELHHMEALFSKNAVGYMAGLFRKLTQNHVVVHAHPNNCCGVEKHRGVEVPRVIELTLLRRDRFRPANKKLEFPHPLDQRNKLNKPAIKLPDCWIATA